MLKKFLLALVFLGIVSLNLFSDTVSQGIAVYSNIDKKNIGIDEQINYRLTIAGSGYFPDPKLPQIKDFSVIKTRQFTSIDFSKGRPLPYTVFEYIFTPYQKGNFLIPKIAIEYKGYFYYSEAYNISVGDKIRRIEDVKTLSYVETRNISGDSAPIFIRSSISSSDVFYNQQIIYTYTLFTRVSIKKLPVIKVPEFEAFHIEPLYYRREYATDIGGMRYRAVEFKFAIFPYMTDTHSLKPLKMFCYKDNFPVEIASSVVPGNSLVKETQSFRVNIKPLPLKDKPLNFSGLIGDFEITQEVDKQEIAVDEELVLTVRVKGSGNIRSIPHIKCPFMDNLREYNSDTFMNYDKKESKIIGEKLFRFLLIPREVGEDTIPSIGFSYFDEKEQKYLTKWTEPIKIKIVKKKKAAKSDDNNSNQSTETQKKGFNFKNYFYAIGVVLALIIVFFVLKARKNKNRN